jgi:predicted amidohydrolase
VEAKGLVLSGRCIGPDRRERGRWGILVHGVEGQMTANKNLKRRVRVRAASTRESYTTALHHLSPTPPADEVMSAGRRVRLAVAQTTERNDPTNVDLLRDSGNELRRLMRDAQHAGARMVHFTEGATCFPHKLIMSAYGPDTVGPADWTRFAWDVLHTEVAHTAALARRLHLWTVIGSVHPLTAPNRPHNSMYVISDRGVLATRYDERTLSTTKSTYMYTAGSLPVTFEVDGLRFGCALGMDIHFPELYSEYEHLDVDCVLTSTTGSFPHDVLGAIEAQGHAAANGYWISYAVPAQHSTTAPSGVISPAGDWIARCPHDGRSALALIDIDASTINNGARNYRRTTRATFHDRTPVSADTRSDDRSTF